MSATRIKLQDLGFLTTKGDVLSFDGTNHVRLAVGANRKFLLADSSASSGLRWGFVLAAKGDLFTNDGTQDIGLTVGTDGFVLVADSAQATGLRWGSVTAAAGAVGYISDGGLGVTAATDSIGGSSTANNNFTLSSALFGYTFPVNTLTAGNIYRLTISGTLDRATGNGTFRVYFGNQSILLFDSTDGGAISLGVGNGQSFEVVVYLRVLTVGASGTLRANGMGFYQTAQGSSSKSVTVDTTATQQLTASFQWTVSNAGNLARIHHYFIERIK